MSSKYVALTDQLNDYVLAHRSNVDDPVLDALRAETENLGEIGEMAIGRYQGDVLNFLAEITGAKWAVEVGTFTGMSSICIARGLAPGGKLICFDQDFKWTTIARRYWQKAGVQDRIELRLGNAREVLPRFRFSHPLDFAFIDADKESYNIYYEALLPKMRTGGLMVFDNMLQAGQVIDPTQRHAPATRAINQLNYKLATDDRVQSIMLPVVDGLHLCRKLREVI
ncbi:MAG TPA: class I SAM-dependent methyltransferase [Candidatus Methylacidiphilales bacterium]|nr:class I SAM-dependent methyltransferase [Candidatus Methylacidiphilales bacterium]